MRRFLLCGIAVLLCFALGCVNTEARVKGVWKATESKSTSSKGIEGAIQNAIVGILGGDATIEFNGDGAFKISSGPLSTRGTVKTEGDTLVLIPESDKPKQNLKFKLSNDGNKLEQVTEFSSDPKLVLTRKE